MAANLSQATLCERAGISTRALQDLERGVARPRRDTARRLGAALGLPADVLEALDRALTPTPRRRSTLPSRPAAALLQLTSFVGREADLAELGTLLERARLVTLTGHGGIGKTRLALELAARVNADVALVELGALADERLIVAQTAEALGVREQPTRSLLDTLSTALGDAQRIILFDNCEHLIDAAASLVAHLLGQCPRLRILATSREPLRVEGESIWRVAPLASPDPADSSSSRMLETHAATRLFLERAAAASGANLTPLDDAAGRAVARICHRLEGLPLAIELAAARTRMFSFEQIADRLDDVCALLSQGSRTAAPRQQTLRATLDWSYALLTPAEQRLLLDVSIFAGGWTFEAAEAVVSEDAGGPDAVLTGLAALVDKSLVLVESTDHAARYRLLVPLREYCQERLASMQGAAEPVRERHAAYYLGLAQAVPRRLQTAERRLWLDRLERELDNVRAAHRFLIERSDAEGAQQLSASVYFALTYRCYASEGRQCLLEALALEGSAPATRARALHTLAALAVIQADYPAANDFGLQSLWIRRTLDDDGALAWSFFQLGCTALLRAELMVACSLFDAGYEAAQRASDAYLVATISGNLAYARYLSGQHEAAIRQADHTLTLIPASGFEAAASMALTTLGSAAYQLGDVSRATSVLASALVKAEALDEQYLIARAALSAASICAQEGEFGRAARLLRQSVHLCHQLGNPHMIARALEGVATYAVIRGATEQAHTLLASAAKIRDSIATPRSPTEHQILKHCFQRAAAHFDAPASAMDPECAVSAALTFLAHATPTKNPSCRAKPLPSNER